MIETDQMNVLSNVYFFSSVPSSERQQIPPNPLLLVRGRSSRVRRRLAGAAGAVGIVRCRGQVGRDHDHGLHELSLRLLPLGLLHLLLRQRQLQLLDLHLLGHEYLLLAVHGVGQGRLLLHLRHLPVHGHRHDVPFGDKHGPVALHRANPGALLIAHREFAHEVTTRAATAGLV